MADLIGVFGGTFDPPHLAHLILAEEARLGLGLSKVLWVVTSVPPHKPDQPISPLAQRLAMVEIATADNPGFSVSRADIDREPPYYAHGTLRWLQERNPSQRFAYIMGGDSLADLPAWDHPGQLLELCEKLVVMRRPGTMLDVDQLFVRFPALESKLVLLDVPLFEISGRVIRERARAGGAYRYFLLPAIHTYLKKHDLYR